MLLAWQTELVPSIIATVPPAEPTVHGLFQNWGDMMVHVGSNATSVAGPLAQNYGHLNVAVAAMSNSPFATKYPAAAFVIKARGSSAASVRMHACTAGQRAHALASRLTPAAPLAPRLQTAIVKTHTDWAKTMLRAIGCNWMVCMAVWLSFCATDVFSKCFVIWFCITLFISIGFEHLVRSPRAPAARCGHALRACAACEAVRRSGRALGFIRQARCGCVLLR